MPTEAHRAPRARVLLAASCCLLCLSGCMTSLVGLAEATGVEDRGVRDALTAIGAISDAAIAFFAFGSGTGLVLLWPILALDLILLAGIDPPWSPR